MDMPAAGAGPDVLRGLRGGVAAGRGAARGVPGLPRVVRGGADMATLTMAKALNDGPARGDGARPEGAGDGRGRRQARRRLPGHRRAAEGLRRAARAGHPAGRVRHHRHRRRARDPRVPAGVRDPVRRVRVPRLRPDRLAAGQAALPLAGPGADAGRRAHPVRRRDRRGGAPQRVAGGAVRARRRAQGGGLLERGRRLLDDPAGHRLRRPGDLLRAQAALLGEGRGRPDRHPAAAAQRRGWCGRARRSRSSATGRCSRRAWRRPPRRPRTATTSR